MIKEYKLGYIDKLIFKLKQQGMKKEDVVTKISQCGYKGYVDGLNKIW